MINKNKNTRVEKLLKHWIKADALERDEFLSRIGVPFHIARRPPMIEPNITMPAGDPRLIANGRYLLPATKARIEEVMKRRAIRPSDIMQELGFQPNDPCLIRALARGSSLRLAVIAALDTWLSKNESTAGAH